MRSFATRCRPRIGTSSFAAGPAPSGTRFSLSEAFFHVEIFRPLHLSGGRCVPSSGSAKGTPTDSASLRHRFLFDAQPPVLVIVHDVALHGRGFTIVCLIRDSRASGLGIDPL